MQENQIRSEMNSLVKKDWLVLIALLLLATFVRLPFLDTTHAIIGDELMWGNAANNVLKDPHFMLNACLHVIHPPVVSNQTYGVFNRTAALPLLLSGPIAILGPDMFSLRILPCIFGIALVAIIYLLGHHIGGRTVAVSSALITAVLPMPVFMSRVALNEIFIAVLGFGSIYLMFKTWQRARWYSALVIGFIIGYGYLIKPFQIAVIIVPACLVLLLQKPGWRLFRWFVIMAILPVMLPTILMLLKYWTTPWSVPLSWDSVWFSDNYQWKKDFGFYFVSLIEQYSLLLPLMIISIIAFIKDFSSQKKSRVTIFIAVAAMILLISIPGTKKETYFFIIAPAFFILAGNGVKELLTKKTGKSTVAIIGVITLLLIIVAVSDPERLTPIPGIPYKILNPDLAIAVLPPLVVAAALLVLVISTIEQNQLKHRLMTGTSILVSTTLVISLMTSYIVNEDINSSYHRNYKPELLLTLLKGMKSVYGSDRDLLIGDRPHASAAQYYSGTSINAVWVPRFTFDRPNHERFLRRSIFGRYFILFADVMRYPLSKYRSHHELPEGASKQMKALYRMMDKSYKRIPQKILTNLELDTKIPFYILKDLDAEEILSEVVAAGRD